MSKIELATKLGITPRMLRSYETEGAPLARAESLAQALGVRPEFLTKPEIVSIGEHQGFFRARRRATSAQLRAARAVATIGAEVYDWIAARFELPPVQVPDLDAQDPAVAAESLRAWWGRGGEPLPNLVQLAEAHGVRVMSLPVEAETVDAFSLWLDERPYVFLSTSKTAERSRFDLAHELGHLTMHSRNMPMDMLPGRDEERQADEFASSLLMPQADLLARSGREPAIPQILRLRSYYRVSAMAVTRRLHEIGRLSEWTYRQNCVQLTQRGFRSGEPGGTTRELSRVFAVVFPQLRRQGVKAADLARALGLDADELHDLVFGQLTASVTGAGQRTASTRPALRSI